MGIIVTIYITIFSPDMLQTVWNTAVEAGQVISFGKCLFFFFCCLGELICIFLTLYKTKRIFEITGKGNSPFINIMVSMRKIVMYIVFFTVFAKNLLIGYFIIGRIMSDEAV